MAGRSIIIAAAIWLGIAAGAGAQVVINVGPGEPFPFDTWSGAIGAISPLAGPTILEGVPGTVLESGGVIISGTGTSPINTLTLRGGMLGGVSTIDGVNIASNVVEVFDNFVSIENLRIIRPLGSPGNAGIFASGAGDVRILNNTVEQIPTGDIGIKVEVGSNNAVISGNTVDCTGGADEGIHTAALNAVIDHNLVFGHGVVGINVHQNTADNIQIFHNTVHGPGDALGFNKAPDPSSVTGARVFNNIFVTNVAASFCMNLTDPASSIFSAGGFSNFNLFFRTAGGNVSNNNGTVNATLAAHQTNTLQDANSLDADPLFVNPGGLPFDFHPQSPFGSFNDATQAFDIFSPSLSPAIDRADPASPFAVEPPGNGGRANLGAFGNTPFASRSSLPAAAPKLICARPIGVSTAGGTRVRLFGANIGGTTAVNLGASFPSIDATGSGLSAVNNDILDFTMPSMSAGQKFIEVVTGSGTDEIRNAITVSGSVATVSHGVRAGNTIQSYQMKSVPLFAGARDVLGQLETCLGPYSPNVWRAFTWDSEFQQFAELTAVAGRRPDRDLSGGGLFVISTRAETCSFTGLSTEPASNFYICLRQGWNMVSLPSTGQIAWSAVRAGTKGEGSTGADDVPASSPNPFVFELPFFYLDGSYVTVTQLVESESYWVFCRVAAANLFFNDPAPKAGEPAPQTFGTPPEGAPTPPGPPGSVDSSFSADPSSSGGGGGGGGDSATQVGATGSAAALLTVLLLLRTVRARRRGLPRR